MNIDLLPFSSLALEACAPVTSARGDSHTLTLRLALAHTGQSLMQGTATVRKSAPASSLLRAAVVPADASMLTLTF